MGVVITDPVLETRIDGLLAALPLQRKLGQLLMTERASTTPEDVTEAGIGAVLSGGGSTPGANRPSDWLGMADAYWHAAQAVRIGPRIPVVYAVDAVHGHANVLGATVLPHNIGLGATRDPALVGRLARVCAREILATGLDWNFAPTLAVAKNVQWGRVYESFGDDPALVASFAAPAVEGLQGQLGEDGVIACAKHWLGDGGTTFGEDQGDTVLGADALRDIHAAPYVPALDAGVLSVMASFNAWNGVRCHGHQELLTGWLKGAFGFAGVVVSDWDGVHQLDPDLDTALIMGLNAGIDMIMVSADWRAVLASLRRIVADGRVPLARVDDAVRRILRMKLRAGVFAAPPPSERQLAGDASFGGAEHRAVAREAVAKSQVLLKHDRPLLPLRPGARILVAGKNAHDRGHQCGGFTVAWQGVSGQDQIEGGTSIWEAVRAENGAAELDPSGMSADPARHDVAVVVIGERPYAEGAGDIRPGGRVASGSGFPGEVSQLTPYGPDIQLATLHPEDLATLRLVRSRGVPVIALMITGRPLVIEQELAEADAFVVSWLPGSEGAGVSDVLFGHAPFTGRLPMRWPAIADRDPSRTGERFPAGFGLTLD